MGLTDPHFAKDEPTLMREALESNDPWDARTLEQRTSIPIDARRCSFCTSPQTA